MAKPFVVCQEGLRILIDPDDESRKKQLVIEYRLTPEEIQARYGHIKGQGTKPSPANSLEEYWNKRGEEDMSRVSKISTEQILEVCREHGTGKVGYTALSEAFGINMVAAKNLVCKRDIRGLLKQEFRKEMDTEEYPDLTTITKDLEKKAAEVVKASARKIMSEVDEMMEMVPEITNPPHYLTGGIETIDYIKAKLTAEGFEGFCIGTVMQYISRYRYKGGLQDLKKAEQVLQRIIKVKETA